MKKLFYILAFLFISFNGHGQLPFLEDFENGSGGFSTSKPLCNDGNSDYYTITDGTDMNGNYVSNTGSFFAAQDIDGSPCNSSSNATITFTGIDITGCSSLTLSVDLAEDNPQEKWDNSDFFHIDISIDGAAAQNIIWFENDGTTFNSSPQLDTDFDGNGDGAALTSTFTNFSNTIAGTGTTITITITMHLESGDEDIAFDNLSITGNCAACPGVSTEPTNESTLLTAIAPNCTSSDITWTNGADATNSLVVISTSAITGIPVDGVNYTASSNFGTGDILNAGEFVIYNGITGSITVNGLSDNTTYFISVFEHNGTIPNCEENYLTGGNSISFTTMTGCVTTTPQITSIIYNSCNGTSEGINEIFTFTTGSTPIDIDDIVIDYPNSLPSNYCNNGCGTNTNINNPTYVTDLNTAAGCTIFAYANPIPANADVMVFTGNPPTVVLDYSSQCGAANLPVYVLFNNNTSDTQGRFKNGSSTPKTLSVSFGGGLSDDVTYIPNNNPNNDGATVNFDAPGNANYYMSNDCVYPLPVNLSYFNGESINGNIHLSWATESERNNNYFNIEKSIDGFYYTTIGKVDGANNSSIKIDYQFIDQSEINTTSFYRLKQVDFNGKTKTSYPIKIRTKNISLFYSDQKIYINTKHNSNKIKTLYIYTISGQIIHTQQIINTEIITWQHKGFYILEIPEIQMRKKIICE